MSNRYKGAVISATPPTTSGGPSGTASGAWTLEQQLQLQAAGLWPSQPPPNYIEEVFSTFLYTGTGAAQTITNGINLSANGGLVWTKRRDVGNSHALYDTVRGIDYYLSTNSVGFSAYSPGDVTSFNTTGFSLGSGTVPNTSGGTYASWTFREQAKFFDVVTWTGSGANRTIAHSLGSVPGCIIVKRTDTTADWAVYHRSLANTQYLVLNTSAAAATGATWWNSTTPTSSVFSVGTDASVNASGGTYVAYVFAHDAGGFGPTETDNVISCGTFTAGTGSVNLGYEPQWIMFKGLTGSNEWIMFDTMRGWPTEAPNKLLMAEYSSAESDTSVICQPTATGFNYSFSPSCIYVAIRRGPMAVPTVGTSVFSPVARNGTGATAVITTPGFPPDMTLVRNSNNYADSKNFVNDRLRGNLAYLITQQTSVEASNYTTQILSFDMLGFTLGADQTNGGMNYSAAATYINYFFRRAPSFFDEVCYTGTGSYPFTINHNLGVVPELMIFKTRSTADGWYTYAKPITSPNADWYKNYGSLNNTNAFGSDSFSFTSSPTSTTIPVAAYYAASGVTYVAYLFATCAGVSKVGTYTGNASNTVTVPCGFTAGVRFVLIKRTDSTGDWYFWDSARGIVAGNDPYLLLNSTAAEVTGTDYVDTYAAGFEVTSTAPADLNATGGTYIFLAIA